MIDMKRQEFRQFGPIEQQTWRTLFNNLIENRRSQAHPIFQEGIEFLGLKPDSIPDLNLLNKKLKTKTGWTGVPVEGLEEGDSFYPALSRREYPIGNFIRDAKDINYTPAPDIFHDLYGHLPFFVNEAYASFCADYGNLVRRHMSDPQKKRMLERFFWFTIEFAIIETPQGNRIFGAGIVSSKGECEFALSDRPKVLDFDIPTICEREFKIDEFQGTLFKLKSPEQLYGSLQTLESYVLKNYRNVVLAPGADQKSKS